jgi:ABC-type multidrug transport system ATPase subunit
MLASLRVESVGKLYGRQRALSGVTVELAAGELCALLGPNGAGKSTLIGVLSSLVRPTSGRIVAPGAGRLRAHVGLLAHDSLVYPELTAVENLIFWGRLYDVADAAARGEALLDEVGLERAARARPARTYSRGMLQRLSLARALLSSPSLLLLDEPFTGLDRPGAAALSRALRKAKEGGAIVLCATHDLEAIDGMAEHVVVLKAGRVVLDERRAAPFSREELRGRIDGATA